MLDAAQTALWDVQEGSSPLVATAIHDGHEVRQEVSGLMAVSEADRLREEDPHTGTWARLADTYVIAKRSRFEVDLNRPREKAVYIRSKDAWGIKVWRRRPPKEVVEESLSEYDAFYTKMEALFLSLEKRWGRFVVLDLHSYNHRRAGPGGPVADGEGNPDVNVGTGTMDRARWAAVVERFIGDLRAADVPGRQLDVGENVKFKGGYFAKWTHERFPESGRVLAVEWKKFFMDEWTGVADQTQVDDIAQAVRSTFPGVLEELARLGPFESS